MTQITTTMRKKILLLMGIFSFEVLLYAQIGINTEEPMALFHIDASGNNSTAPVATRSDDDVVITADGKMGLGTVDPQQQLEIINGKLTIRDGSQHDGYVLESNDVGVAAWVPVKLNTVAIWQLSVPQRSYGTSIIYLNGTGTLIRNDFSATIADNNSLNAQQVSTITIPRGRYLIYPSCDLAGNEYGVAYVYRGSDLATPLFEVEYSYLSNGAFVLDLANTESLFMAFKAINANVGAFMTPPYNVTVVAKLIIQKIP